LRSCDKTPVPVPVAIGDVTVTCGTTFTLSPQGASYGPSSQAGAGCFGAALLFLGFEAASRRKADAKIEAKVHEETAKPASK
jgi:hypothetical protein